MPLTGGSIELERLPTRLLLFARGLRPIWMVCFKVAGPESLPLRVRRAGVEKGEEEVCPAGCAEERVMASGR